MHMYGVSIFESRTENPCVGGSIPPLGTILTAFLPSKSFRTLIAHFDFQNTLIYDYFININGADYEKNIVA